MTGPIERPDFRVIVRILEALWKAERPLRPTQLQQASGTNYAQLLRYVELLRDRGLLILDGESDSRMISLTPRGEEAHRFLVESVYGLLPPPTRTRSDQGHR